MENETKHSGYVYSKETKKGFLRMQRLGIPRPPFRLEDKITRKLSKIYKRFVSKMIIDFIKEAKNSNAFFENGKITTEITSDGKSEVEKELSRAEKNVSLGVHNFATNKSAVQTTLWNLQNWKPDYFLEYLPRIDIQDFLKKSFDDGADDFAKKLLQDSSQKMSERLTQFSLDKNSLYQKNMNLLKEFYIDDSLQRIKNEFDFLKMAFLTQLTDYVQGNDETLDLVNLLNSLSKSAEKGSRFFARDQMQRFNKAQTLSTFVSAGVKTIKWCSCRDSRVRPSHKALDGKIFNVRDLPNEVNDYNCRCGLVPVEYEDD